MDVERSKLLLEPGIMIPKELVELLFINSDWGGGGGGGGGGSTSFHLIRAAKKGKIGMR